MKASNIAETAERKSLPGSMKGHDMNIVIVGAGNVGRALGSGWLKTGHKVTMAVREPTSSKAIELKKRLLVPVHHRLRLLTFPMRTVPLTRR